MEKLALVLQDGPPYVPRKFGRCVVIGKSGDLLKTKFGKEIDSYDAVLRENGAPIQNFSENVGTKSTFRLLNRGSAKALDKVAELYDKGKEVLIVKTTIHDIMNKMIQEIPILNPVYLILGSSFGSAAKSTGLKALEFTLSICDTVDMYGFTVDPGYKEWTRYFSESRQGHTPLHGRAYYQMMECLGVYGNGLIKSEGLKRGLQNMESSDYEKLATMKELENQLPEDEDDQIGQNDLTVNDEDFY
ncbi:sialyltransferase-like protein 2 [Primulina tabacum]|uniref:sialyltransferase-like protein 2 n=1 Tax=Primulina tabacum TaxID=48773 RepID=UPI003F5A633F